jgi:hypothetical protein
VKSQREAAGAGERRVVLALCLFPLFNNVDEQAQFDLVYKYAHGYLPPSGVDHFSRGSAEIIARYGSPEFLLAPTDLPDWFPPQPLWTRPDPEASDTFRRDAEAWQASLNVETGNFPAYYLLAGAWCALGSLLGVDGGGLPYWVRFLNAPLLAALVWIGHRAAGAFFPGNRSMRLGVPLLLACFPHDVLYSINADALSPLLFGAGFVGLLWIRFGRRSLAHDALTGLAIAGALLTKPTNVILLPLVSLVLALELVELRRGDRLRRELPRILLLGLIVALPTGLWLARNQLVLGGWSGSAAKLVALGWTTKPLLAWGDHPIFTPAGLGTFLKHLTEHFWRGGLVWHGERLRWAVADGFYLVSTLVFLLASAAGWARRAPAGSRARFTLASSFAVVALAAGTLATLSLAFDFGATLHPSRERPYFVDGRLVSGVLLPFVLLYVYGLDRVTSRLSRRGQPLLLLAVIAVAITASEIALSLGAFASPYNWFHIVGLAR